MRVSIVGAGVMGLSAAWGLARRGHEVEVYEQGPIPNPMASSVDQHRLIRTPYSSMGNYARMVRDAHAAWDRLWEDLGERLYAETGILAIDSGPDSWARVSGKTLDEAGIPWTRLTPADVVERWPILVREGMEGALYMQEGGPLFAGRIVELLAHHLARRGVRLFANSMVTAVNTDTGELETSAGRTAADMVVVAAGAWVGRLLPDLASRVTPSRQVIAYLEPPANLVAAWSEAPAIIDIGADGGFYLVPPVAGHGMKVGDHTFTMTGAPDRDRVAGEDETRQVYERLRHRLGGFDRYRLGEGKTCFYTVEGEERFVIEPVGPAAWVMTGFSGHGFKFGALMGEELAKTISGERDGGEFSAWAAGRRAP
ncbi:MAG: FAD-dependent oxidoreductase [Alphaproteobacteria bacterium]|nr:FAD-dependent oxidoreductase [Alphaproteobacteria bacterium]